MPERADERSPGPGSVAGRLADTSSGNAGTERLQRSGEYGQQPQDGSIGRLADSDRTRPCERQRDGSAAGYGNPTAATSSDDRLRSTNAPVLGRTPVDWLYCRDGKWRPVEPGTFPLVDADTSRVGKLRAYGNGLDLETAAQFVGAFKEIADGL